MVSGLATAQEAARRQQAAMAANGANSGGSRGVVGSDQNVPWVGTDGTNVDQLAWKAEVVRLDREDLPALRQRLVNEQAKLKELQDSQPRPEWPVRFEPIDPEPSDHMAVAASAAPSVSASSQPSAATQPVRTDPLSQAVALMAREEMVKARSALDAIWKATPVDQRSRALVLDRAIASFPEPRLAVLTVRDLRDYLLAHQADDELATDILGSALHSAAMQGDRIKRGEVWQSAYREWARRNELLEQSRPGFHRWGPQWLSDEQFNELRGRQRELESQISAQQRVVDATLRTIGSIQAAGSIAEYVDDPNSPMPTINAGLTSLGQPPGLASNPTSTPQLTPQQRLQPSAARDRRAQVLDWRNLSHFYELHAREIDANARLKQELAALDALLSRRERPTWPAKYDPLPAE
jgi:hypothetical protein